VTAPWRPDLAGYGSVIGQAFRDAIRYQREHRDGDDWAAQAGLYRVVVRELGLNAGTAATGPVRPAVLPDWEELTEADVAAIVAGLRAAAWLVLEQSRTWCQACAQSDDEPCDEHAADIARVDAWRELAERLAGAQ
jgi:hypothetical protein